MVSGTYYVQVTNNLYHCQVATGEVQIVDNTVNPNIAITVNQNDILSTVILEGSLSASVEGVTDGYSFEWYQETDVSGTALSETFDLTEVAVGSFTVLVTDTEGDNLGCQSIQTAAVEQDNRTEQTITGIEGLSETTKIYPNPVQNLLTIESVEKMTHISIFNSTGAIVNEKNIIESNLEVVDLSDMNTGIYFIHIITRNEIKISKIIKR